MNQKTKPLTETLLRGRGTRDWLIHGDYCRPLHASSIVAAGYTHLGRGYELIRLQPAHANIVVCCQGQLQYLIDNHWHTASVGSVLVAPHAAPHGVRTAQSPALTAWVAFDPTHSPARPWDAHHTRLAGIKDHRPLLWALQGLYAESNGSNDHTTLNQWANLVLTSATRLADESHDEGPSLRQVWETVDADLSRPWSADTIAELANLSASHFRRLCRQKLGHSPVHHLAQLRMQRAAMLLTTTSHKLSTIAAAVGYDNPFAFSVAFKRHLGHPPAHHRHSR